MKYIPYIIVAIIFALVAFSSMAPELSMVIILLSSVVGVFFATWILEREDSNSQSK